MASLFKQSLGPVSRSVSTRMTHSMAGSNAAPRHLLSINDVSASEFRALVERAAQFKTQVRSGDRAAAVAAATGLTGQTVAMMFSKRSTRTRVSTEAAVNYLGGHPMFLGKDDIQLGVNESLYDTGRVISSMVSCMVARVGPHSDIAGLAAASSVPVINALCDTYHPLQAIADVLTIREAFGRTEGLKLAWVGDANNVLNDLSVACAKSGISVAIATPEAYPVNPAVLAAARDAAAASGASISTSNDPLEAVRDADVIVTDTWISMGQETEKQLRLKQFAGYQVNADMVARGKPKPGYKFMHCLPRHPEEVSDEIFYSDSSLVFEEAENRLYAALSALEGFVVNKGRLV
ncbi:Aspartate/ornithine carbamoyltransferase [Dipodascopsis tothii]|uniref:Aspartate/ornithine carbamoyltransferase n=1 Tax=Dipodascopsis tothii TaxID=44089 RepID=UPI0034CD48A8